MVINKNYFQPWSEFVDELGVSSLYLAHQYKLIWSSVCSFGVTWVSLFWMKYGLEGLEINYSDEGDTWLQGNR